nr:uncharacterized protein LOC117864555 [Setaria viridis]
MSDSGGPNTHIEQQVGGDEVEEEEDVQSNAGGNEELDYEEQEGGDAEHDVASQEPTGEADEGKEIPELVEQIEMEGEEANGAVDEDSSDEEDDYPVNVGENIHWEYRKNEVCMGAVYQSGDEVKVAIKRWSTLCLQRQFRVEKSSPKVYDVQCVRNDCPFRVHAYKGKWKDYWEIVENPSFELKSIICAIEEKFKYKINYNKAYRAKQKVLEMKLGIFEASYDNLLALLYTICQRNPGSFYDLKAYPVLQFLGKQVLQRSFLALGPCIQAFQLYRLVICIDGTFFTGRYKGTILTAIGTDGNNQVLPLAIAFVEKESGDNWYWFLERVKNMIVLDVEGVCLIHDWHKGIIQAIDDLQNGSQEHFKAPIWPDLKSRWCMRHMGANFHSQFKNKTLMKLFKCLCNQNQERKFNLLWKKLEDLTKKQCEKLVKRVVNSEADQPVSLEDVGLDGPNGNVPIG